jgi:hypothetical protein
VIIRPIRADDRERWDLLWQSYLDFYRAVLTPEVTEGTWAALCDPTSAVHGLVAEQEDRLTGFAHLVLHPTTWAIHPTCYLEDLYVAKQWRGGTLHTGSSRPSTHSPAPPASTGLPRSTTPRPAPYTTPSPIGHRSSYTGAESG